MLFSPECARDMRRDGFNRRADNREQDDGADEVRHVLEYEGQDSHTILHDTAKEPRCSRHERPRLLGLLRDRGAGGQGVLENHVCDPGTRASLFCTQGRRAQDRNPGHDDNTSTFVPVARCSVLELRYAVRASTSSIRRARGRHVTRARAPGRRS